jgi:phosphomethylpyrimidine synthase
MKYRSDAKDRHVAMLRAAPDCEGQIRCSMDPARARVLSDGEVECTMCGEFCAIKMMGDF